MFAQRVAHEVTCTRAANVRDRVLVLLGIPGVLRVPRTLSDRTRPVSRYRVRCRGEVRRSSSGAVGRVSAVGEVSKIIQEGVQLTAVRWGESRERCRIQPRLESMDR